MVRARFMKQRRSRKGTVLGGPPAAIGVADRTRGAPQLLRIRRLPPMAQLLNRVGRPDRTQPRRYVLLGNNVRVMRCTNPAPNARDGLPHIEAVVGGGDR